MKINIVSGRKHFLLAPGEDIAGSMTGSLLRNKKGSGRHRKSDPILVLRFQFQRSAGMCECSLRSLMGCDEYLSVCVSVLKSS